MRPQFAPVAPPRMLGALKAAGLLGNYHLLLAHDVAAQPIEYDKVFRDMDKAKIIMDNSLIELGHPAPIDMMLAACEAVSSNFVVLPDHLGDMQKTIDASTQAAEEWFNAGLGPFIGVLQGQTLQEVYACGRKLAGLKGVKGFSVPRVLQRILGTRQQVVSWLLRNYPEHHIHLLGFSDDLMDDFECARIKGVHGIDSAVPIRYGQKGLKLEVSTYGKVDFPRGDYWETANEMTPAIRENMLYVHYHLGRVIV